MFDDTYKTIKEEAKGLYSEKGSKFIALAYPVTSEDVIKSLLTDIKKSYHDARHHCYAYILGADKAAYRMNDDGEPSGTAGRPIYGQLLSKDLTNILVVVVRYFGGTKLGVPGLINAYRSATIDALEHSEIIEKTVDETYTIIFDYLNMNRVMQILKNDEVKINSQSYEEGYVITFTVRRKEAGKVLDALQKIEGIRIKFVNM